METIIERQRRQHEECERLENALTEELLSKKQTVSKKTRHMCTRQTVLYCCCAVHMLLGLCLYSFCRDY